MSMMLKQENIPDFVKTHLFSLLKDRSIVTFAGPLGAGKTTMIREILRQFDVNVPITSPTFGYVKSYTGRNAIVIHHFDLYRINTCDAFIDAGFDEYLIQKNSVCLIEWPEIVASILAAQNTKEKVINISIDYHPIDQKLREVAMSVQKIF